MYQQILIVGNLGTDPELRYTPTGQAVCNFNVATNRKWTDGQGNQQEETTWFRVSTWGKSAEACNQYLNKGRQVFVQGRLKPDPETGGPRVWYAQDNSARASYELNAFEVKFLGGRETGWDAKPQPAAKSAAKPAAEQGWSFDDAGPGVPEDEIPF